MRIVIDLQGAQADNRNRGIGRYSLSLALAIVRNRGEHEVILALNGLFPETIQPIRATFNGLLSQANIRVWQVPAPVNSITPENDWRRRSAELVREAFLASLKPDIVLVSSLFEGLVDDSVTSIGTLSQTVPTAVILYDLIPLINRQPYLENAQVEAWYENKLDHLRRANRLLAISESSRQEGIRYLGFPTEAVVNISTAADPQFLPRAISTVQEAETRSRYGLRSAFVMYTGGIDHRKNIEGLIRSYAKLPNSLRAEHQLAVVCAISPPDRARIEALAKEHGLKSDEVVLTGYVSEEDLVVLYNLCKVFVFPSWHEGFGLPALEAMCCGRAVIGANTSSQPEVIGREDALFDPRSDAAIADKLTQVLSDDAFRTELERHGLEQAGRFSWDASAQRAIAALETWYAEHIKPSVASLAPARRPRLAYVSPLPPERSGISDYSAELLPELARHYDVEVIVAQESVSDVWIRANCQTRTVDWFNANADSYDRVLYHFGNSAFHQHMFDLLEKVPGVVVLHDFYLSGIVEHMDVHGLVHGGWAEELYRSHGYHAVRQRYHAVDTAEIVWKYPANLSVLQNAEGVIVHSESSRRLAQQWYGTKAGSNCAHIPLLRKPVFEDRRSRDTARKALGLTEADFVVCSFGLLGPTKLNHRLLDAWLNSTLAANARCVLVFVGENHGGVYGQQLLAKIHGSEQGGRIRITGWADADVFRQYLAAADVGVQLRAESRGETSAAVLDCMNHGLPTIVNANGSMADLPGEGVWKLPDDFEDRQLTQALETLWQDGSKRRQLGLQAQKIIHAYHAPRNCAVQYFAAIEGFHRSAATGIPALMQKLVQLEPAPNQAAPWVNLAQAIDASIEPALSKRQLFVDISELVQRDAKSGIQRVVRSILQEWLTNPPADYRIEPIYATAAQQGYRYARQFTLEFLGCPNDVLSDEPVSCRAGDIFIGLDLQPEIITAQQDFYQAMRRSGVSVQFVVYDLLIMQLAHCFPIGAAASFEKWLAVVAESDGAICISQSVADELSTYLSENTSRRGHPFTVGWFHLGADIERSAPTTGLLENANKVFASLKANPSFLMVGTVEPRKGHAQTLFAFEQLWTEGVDANLVIVGKQGWMIEALSEKIRNHPEQGKRLFWLEGISDEYLEQVYAASTCLIAASEGEGFGLPLIEAAQHKLPIIARDIAVFREVAREHAYYFSGVAAQDLRVAVSEWLGLYQAGLHPTSGNMPWLTWKESAEQLQGIILKGQLAQPAFVDHRNPHDPRQVSTACVISV